MRFGFHRTTWNTRGLSNKYKHLIKDFDKAKLQMFYLSHMILV